MASPKSPVEEYLEMTGDEFDDLFAGAETVGMPRIINELVPKALRERKRIVWTDVDGRLDGTEYSLEKL